MAAKDIVPSLFGLTPEMYQEGRQAQIDQQALQYAKLDPFERASFALGRGGNMLGGAIGRALGREDPEEIRIRQQQELLRTIDPSNTASLVAGAKKANSMGLSQLSLSLVDRAKELEESSGRVAYQNAQLLKAMEAPKLTGDERYMNMLQTVENIILSGKEPSATQLSAANMAGQLLSKPRSYLDAASGQMITQPATDPSKAYPLTYKVMGASTEGGATTTPKPTVQQATTGNLPTTSQQEIADIEANLLKIKSAAPQLERFSNLLKSGDVKFNAAANAFDFLGAVVPPIFGGEEVGNQVKKDEFTRAFTERVNFVLNNAKGVQAKDDANRAKEQIASPSTFYSSARMQGAIDYLKRAEVEYEKELNARKGSLQRQGKPETVETPSAKPEEKAVVAPTKQATPSTSKQPSSPAGLTREQKIQRFIDFNGGRPTRQEAEQALRNAGKL
jgi:hypothetical protein